MAAPARALVCCLFLAFFSVTAAASEPSIPTWKKNTDLAEKEISELRWRGQYGEAESVARGILQQVEDDTDAPPYAREIARWVEQTQRCLAALPDPARDAFHRLENECQSKKDCWRAQDFHLFAEVQARYERACNRVFGHDSYEAARLLLNASHDYANWGRFVQAERLAREALAIDLRIFPPEHPIVSSARGGLACVLMSNGYMDEAEPLFRSVLATVIANEGEQTNEAAGAFNTLGVALTAEGDYEGAEVMLRRAEEIQRSLWGFDHEIFLSSYAKVLLQLGRLDEAEARVRQAHDIYVRVHGDSCSEVALQLASLAKIKQRKGDLQAADSLYARAAAIDRKVLGPEHPQFLSPQICRAEIQLLLANPAAARELLEPLLPDLNPALRVGERAWCLHTLGRALRRQGRNAEAEPVLTEASRLYERARSRAGGEFKRATRERGSPYSDLALCRLDLGWPEQAWTAVECGLARCLADLLLAGRSRTDGEAVRADSLRQNLTVREEEFSLLVNQTRTDPGARPARDKAQAGLLEAEAAWSRYQSGILADHGLPPGGGVSLSTVQAALDSNTALIGWLDDVDDGAEGGSEWGYVIRHRGPVRWVKLRPAGQKPVPGGPDPATTYRGVLVGAANRQVRSLLEDAVEADARRVADERLAPLLPLLGDARRLVVIPSGSMLGVPLEALQLGDGTWLSDRFEVAYSPSAMVFAALSASGSAAPIAGNRILLVGDPVYQRPPDVAALPSARGAKFVVARAPAGFSATALNRDVPPAGPQILYNLPSLPQSREEIQAIAAMFRESRELLGMMASNEVLKGLVDSKEIEQYRYLHFATHALVDDRTPGRSALVLSQAGLLDPAAASREHRPVSDGLLSVKEIMRDWKLHAELITLSGCRTGLGRPAGGEGFLGLAQAFLLAGTRSVLASLWSVDDEATSLFMRRFYSGITGAAAGPSPGVPMSKTAALSEARRFLRDYRDPDGRCRFAHPCYWSGFVLLGNPG